MAKISPKSLGKRIRSLREERKLSQEDIAKALSIHRQSVSLIERGERDLTATELDCLARFLQVSFDEILAPGVKEQSSKHMHGIQFQPEKLRNLLLYLLELVGGRPNVGETVLYKLLYFCDFNHYEKTGKPITGVTYLRLQFGPVPRRNQFEGVITQMLEEKKLKKIEHEYYDMPQVRYIPLAEHDADILSDEELKTIEDVVHKLGHMNARQIEDHVHSDAPWEVTEHQKVIDYKLVAWRVDPHSVVSDRKKEHILEESSLADSEKYLEPLTEEEVKYYMSLPSLHDEG